MDRYIIFDQFIKINLNWVYRILEINLKYHIWFSLLITKLKLNIKYQIKGNESTIQINIFQKYFLLKLAFIIMYNILTLQAEDTQPGRFSEYTSLADFPNIQAWPIFRMYKPGRFSEYTSLANFPNIYKPGRFSEQFVKRTIEFASFGLIHHSQHFSYFRKMKL